MLLAKAHRVLDNLMDFNLSHAFSSLTDSCLCARRSLWLRHQNVYSQIYSIYLYSWVAYIYICCDIVQLYNGNYAQPKCINYIRPGLSTLPTSLPLSLCFFLFLSLVFVQRRAAQFLIKRRQSLIKLVRYFRRYFSPVPSRSPRAISDRPLPSSDPSKSKSLVSSLDAGEEGGGMERECVCGRGDCVMILDSIKFLEFPLKCQA